MVCVAKLSLVGRSYAKETGTANENVVAKIASSAHTLSAGIKSLNYIFREGSLILIIRPNIV